MHTTVKFVGGTHIFTSSHNIFVWCTERAFREQLCVMEGQLGSLQTSCEELGTQRKNSERKDKENNRLKTVISSQDENVRLTYDVVMGFSINSRRVQVSITVPPTSFFNHKYCI